MRGFEDQPIDWAPASVWTDDDDNPHQSVEFIVPGRPVPKGSVIKGRYGGYRDTAKGIYEWMELGAAQAKNAMRGRWRKNQTLPLFLGAVMVDVTFVLPRPKSTPKRTTPPAIKKPDSDKLVRSVLDFMTGIVYHDDAQVVEIHARKRLADIDEGLGAIILVTSNVKVE